MKVKLENVRLSFPDIWHAKEFKTGDGKPRFSATFLVEPGSANDKRIRKAIQEAGAETLGSADKFAKAEKGYWGNSNKCCYQDGDTKDYDGYEGMWYISCHSKTRPTILDRDRSPLTEADGRPYAGCYVMAIVDVWVQKGENPGIRCSLGGIQFYKDGDSFSGGVPTSTDDFDDLAEGADADDDMA